MNRRQGLGLLGALCLGRCLNAAELPFRFTGLDHIEFTVSEVEKSLQFYAAIFGATVMKNNRTTRRYLKLGSSYIAIDKADQIRVDHFCAGIPGFDIAAVHSQLQSAGVMYRDFPSGKDLAVTDPDGTRTQLAISNGWAELAKGTASPESVTAGEAIFRPTGLDHILLNVAEPDKSAEFFEKIFGPVTQRNNNRIWFQVGKSRIGLLQTPAGQKAGVNHFCVAAEPFDYDPVAKRLAAAGAKVETPEVAGAPEFRDPDGFLVQVIRVSS